MAKWSLLGIGALARAGVLFGLWLLLVDGIDEPNLLAGGVCALAAGILVTVVRSLGGERVRVRAAMLRRFHRPFVLLVTDTARVTVALAGHLFTRRRAAGEFRVVRYRATGEDREDRARRLLTEWATSVGANRYAIGIDTERNLLIVHELRRSSGPLDPLELG